jgi:hypothetical protein
MRYLEILHTAKNLTAKNPIFWLFGLVLYGGFNLYFVNFFALFSKSEWKAWPVAFDGMFGSPVHGYAFLVLGAAVMFVVLNVIKIIFIVLTHNELHKVKDLECDLCAKVKAQSLTYWFWLKSVLLTSSVTIVITASITFAISSVIYGYAPDNAPAVVVNILFVILVTGIVGIWNLFTCFFVVMHGMSFSRASKAALDLLTLRMREWIEFVIVISALYALAVIIGNAFIYVWQHGIGGMSDPAVRIVALVIFVLWFALNNSFFNIALVVFFDKMVKTIGVDKEVPDGQLQPNILH